MRSQKKCHFRSLRSIRGRLQASTFIMDSGDFNLRELSEKVKSFTWLIMGTTTVEPHQEIQWTGFAIQVDKNAMDIKSDELVLMTCAHPLVTTEGKNLRLKVRRHDDTNLFEAKFLFVKYSWDIALLLVKGVEDRGIYAEFVDDGSIFNCQTLLHVGHSDYLPWSTFVGRALYPCVNSFVPSSDPKKTSCDSYESPSLRTTSDHRIMGHGYNKQFFKRCHGITDERFVEFAKKLDPFVPVIQCEKMVEGGSSGGPVVNIQGKIVGMIFGTIDDCDFASHVTMLKEYVKECELTTPNKKGETSRS